MPNMDALAAVTPAGSSRLHPEGPVEFRTATQLVASLRNRRVGALEVLDQLIARVERLNPDLNAVVAMDPERAREAARAADNLPPGRRGDLHGLPMTVKDTYEVVGMPATAGLRELANHRPTEDADAVHRLRSAGAIVFGKTNVPAGAGDHQTYNPVHGTTHNPWDRRTTPGGSSGGAAAAVAGCMTPLELGSDVAGSIRCPAHFCGVYGLKPSFGIIPLRGHIPPAPGMLAETPLAVAGPLARSAFDLELALNALVGVNDRDSKAWRLHLPPPRAQTLRGFRVAVWATGDTYVVDAASRSAIESYGQDLLELAVRVDPGARPDLSPALSENVFVNILFATVAAGLTREQLDPAISMSSKGPLETRIAQAMTASSRQTFIWQHQQRQLMNSWQRFFRDYDVLLCPVMPTPAYPHDHTGSELSIAHFGRSIQVDDSTLPYCHGIQWPGLASVAHLPACVIPSGRFAQGLPIGIQVIGPYLEDRTVLRFAQLTEEALNSFRLPQRLA